MTSTPLRCWRASAATRRTAIAQTRACSSRRATLARTMPARAPTLGSRRRRATELRSPRGCRGDARPTRSTACSAACTGATCPRDRPARPPAGGVDVLPTGRNMYSVDPRALPSRPRLRDRRRLADALLRRHLDEDGARETVGIVVWGTAAMRTAGDDAGEILALLGVRPVLEPRDAPGRRARASMPLEELGRPRDRRHRAHLRLLPRRLPAPRRRCSTTPWRWSPASTSRWSGTSSASTCCRSRRRSRARRGDWRARDRAHLRRAPRHLRRGHPAARGRRATGATTPTSPRSTRPGAATPTAAGSTACEARERDAPPVRAHRRRGQEHRQPRARPARLERLLRRARRDDRLRPPPRRRATRGRSSATRPTRERPPRARWPRRRGACSARAWRTRAGSPR